MQHLLKAEGYAVETIGPARADLPLPEPDRLRQLSVLDPKFLDCVRQHERGLIRDVAEQVDATHLIAQIALAWPSQRTAVLASRIEEGRHLRNRLREYGIGATAVTSRNQPPEVGPVAVCTPSGLAHQPVRIEWVDLVIVRHAREITNKVGMECIGHARRARLFGLLEREERPAPLERGFLTSLFGFHEMTIPRHSYRERVVQVLRYPIQGGASLPSQFNALTAKRLGLWQHALRTGRSWRSTCFEPTKKTIPAVPHRR